MEFLEISICFRQENSFYALELISKEEWMDMHTIRIKDRFNYWFAEDKRFKSRYSEQTWLMWEDDKTGTLMDIRDRCVKC